MNRTTRPIFTFLSSLLLLCSLALGASAQQGGTVALISDNPSNAWAGAEVGFNPGDDLKFVIRFDMDIGLIDPSTTTRIRITDDKSDDVLRLTNSTPRYVMLDTDPDVKNFVEIYNWRALRSGTAVIEFVNTKGAVVGTIKVTVN